MKEIPLWLHGEIVAAALVDDEDFASLNQWTWHTNYIHQLTDEFSYAYRTHEQRPYAMARQIMGIPHGDPRVVHHVNEERFDNRRANLLVCASHSEHMRIPHKKRPLRPRTAARRVTAKSKRRAA